MWYRDGKRTDVCVDRRRILHQGIVGGVEIGC
jgi:hypothetical protein